MSVNTKVLIGVAVLVVAVVTVATIFVGPWATDKGSKTTSTYGSMTGYAVQKADVDRLVESYPTVSPTEVAQTLLDNRLYELMAKSLNITVPPADVQAGIGATLANPHPYGEDYLTQAITKNLYQELLTEKLTPGISGRHIYFNFNQNMLVAGGGVDAEFAKLTDAQQKAIIAADQIYALQLANQLYAKLQAKTITVDQAIETEKTDPRLGLGPIPTLTHSGSFNTATEVETSYGLTIQKQLLSVIRTTPVGSYTKILTGTTPTSISNDAPRINGYYVIFAVDQVISGSSKYGSFEQMVTSFKKQHNYQGPKL